MRETSYYIEGLLRQGNAALARAYLEITEGGGAGTVTNTGALTANELVVGNGGTDIKTFASPGDATKFLAGSTPPAFAAVKDSDLSTSDITTNNATTLKHGFLPKLDGNSSNFLDGDGNFSNPTGGMAVGWFRFDSNTTIADPGAGDFRMNTSSWGTVTVIAFDQISDPGNDVTAMIMAMRANDQILIQKKNDSNIYGRFTVTGTPTNNGGWFSVPVTNVVDSGFMPANTQLCAVVVSYDGGGGGSGTVTNTGTLTDHGVIVGNGGVDVSALAVGTTNTVLHGNTGADPSFSAVVEADITLADNTTNNASTSKHGFAPKGSGDSGQFLDGTLGWSTPTGTDYYWDNIESGIIPTGGTTSDATNCLRSESTGTAIDATGANPPLINYATTASIGNIVSVGNSTLTQFPYFQELRYEAYFSVSENTAVRGFVGMTNVAGATMGASDLPAGKYAMFRFSTNVPDTNWMCCTNNNSSSEAISSGVPFVAGTLFRFKITWDGTTTGKVKFYINGSLVHTSSMDLGATDTLGFRAQLTTLANTIKNCRCGGQKLRVNYG